MTTLQARLLDLIAGIPTLRALGRAAGPERRIAELSDAQRRSTMATLRIAFLSALVLELLVELPHLIRFQVEDTEDRLHPVLDGYALLLGGGKNHAAACQRFFQKFCGSAAVSNR